jgi:hypothetical protein
MTNKSMHNRYPGCYISAGNNIISAIFKINHKVSLKSNAELIQLNPMNKYGVTLWSELFQNKRKIVKDVRNLLFHLSVSGMIKTKIFK